MGLSNLPPGVTEADIDRQFGGDESEEVEELTELRDSVENFQEKILPKLEDVVDGNVWDELDQAILSAFEQTDNALDQAKAEADPMTNFWLEREL